MKPAACSLILLTALLALPAPTVAAPGPDYDASVVEITVTYQDHDPQIPWRKKASAIRQGSTIMAMAHRRLIRFSISRMTDWYLSML